MSYVKAQYVLPMELLERIQEYADGLYLYIPKKETNRKGWGENTNSKEQVRLRDIEIYDKYLNGSCTSELAESTWNMEIESRIHAGTIDKELYSKYLQNDHKLAEQYAFDVSTHNRNKSELNYENVCYTIDGENVSLYPTSETVHIEFVCNVPMEIRVDKILSHKLGVSREIIKRMIREGSIIGEGVKDISKAKAKNGMIITITAR